jgi:UDP-GlcNAc:undecaprenyl-phosphate GlcNAc-1-phosphate transferase
MEYLVILFLSLIISLLLTPVIRKTMLKLKILSIPNEDRWHKKPIALMGGIGIFFSFLIASLLRVELNHDILVILIGAGVSFLLGILDDIYGTHPRFKFASQLFIAIGVVYFGVAMKILPSGWMNIALTIFWIVGLTNALNLLDNMDGLSSGVTIIAAMSIFGLSLLNGEKSIALLCLAVAGSCLGFLKYNFNPASIFMGDCGSLFLGYILAVLAIKGGWQHSSSMIATLLSPILILGVPIFDTTLVTILRLKKGRMPWRGGKDHSSHRLVYILRGKEKVAVLIFYILGIIAGSLGVIVKKLDSWAGGIITIVFIIGLIGFGIRLAKANYELRK